MNAKILTIGDASRQSCRFKNLSGGLPIETGLQTFRLYISRTVKLYCYHEPWRSPLAIVDSSGYNCLKFRRQAPSSNAMYDSERRVKSGVSDDPDCRVDAAQRLSGLYRHNGSSRTRCSTANAHRLKLHKLITLNVALQKPGADAYTSELEFLPFGYLDNLVGPQGVRAATSQSPLSVVLGLRSFQQPIHSGDFASRQEQ